MVQFIDHTLAFASNRKSDKNIMIVRSKIFTSLILSKMHLALLCELLIVVLCLLNIK